MQPCSPPVKKDLIYVIGAGWHTEIALPVSELDKNMSFVRDEFHGARYFIFGYGKKTFVTAPPESLSEYILGPVPGPAVIHIVGLKVSPVDSYPPEHTLTLALSSQGKEALMKAMWDDLKKDGQGKPVIVAPSTDPDGLFYAAVSGYNILHTCNTWTADMLHTAGFAVSGDNVTFSGHVMSETQDVAAAQCEALR